MLVLLKNGEVYGWGDNTRAQISGETTETFYEPQKIPLGGEICRVFAGSQQSAALTKNGELVVWGRNDYGSSGLGKKRKKIIVPQILLPRGIRAACYGWGHGLALTDEHSVVVWGVGDSGQLGRDTRRDLFRPEILTPEKFPDPKKKVVGVAVGFSHSFVILEDGTLLTCGSGAEGALGFGNKMDVSTWTELPGIKVRIPRDIEEEWREVFSWMFLGRSDEDSLLHVLPVEVLYHSVSLF
jgi:alpha-tubulin suppressor-like RCC1 family protein